MYVTNDHGNLRIGPCSMTNFPKRNRAKTVGKIRVDISNFATALTTRVMNAKVMGECVIKRWQTPDDDQVKVR